MTAHESHSPADHVISLAHRVDFDTDIDRTGRLQEAARLSVKGEQDVRRILDNDEFFFFCQRDDFLKELGRCRSAGGRVGIVHDQQLGATVNIIGDRIQVGQEMVLGQQRQFKDFATVVACVRTGDRIAGHRHQCHVARD